MFKKLLMVAVVCLLAMPMTATAQKRKLQVQNKGQHHDPIRVAPIKGWENGRPILGEWVAYKPAGVASGVSFPEGVLIDSFEGDTHYGNADVCVADPAVNSVANGPLSGGVSPACDFGGGLTGACGDGDGTRWFLGAGNVWAGSIGAVDSFADNAPSVSTALSFAWFQSFGTDIAPPCGAYVQTYVIVNFYDNTVASKIDGDNIQDLDTTVLAEGFVDGILFDFGPLLSTTGFATSSPDLTKDDPELHLGIVDGIEVGLPSDGALEVLYWDDDGLGVPIPGSYAQPMLWAPKDSALQGSWVAGLFYRDGDNGVTCSTYDGQYLVTTEDSVAQFDDASWPGGCPLILMPMIGLFGEPSTGGPVTVTADAFTVTKGTHVSGGLPELAESDNMDLSIRKNRQDTLSRTEFEVIGTSPTETPTSFGITLEGSAFFRTTVIQTVEVFDYDAADWVLVDTRNASRIVDSTLILTGFGGDLGRFVEDGTLSIMARIHFETEDMLNFRRQVFTSNTDQLFWMIGQ